MKDYVKKYPWLLLIPVLILILVLERTEIVPERTYMSINIEAEEAGGIPIIHEYLDWDSRHRPGEVRDIMYITVHETDNTSRTADAAAHAVYLATNTANVNGWHYTVDDHSIYHHIPDNEVAWNAGDGRTVHGGNINGIGIEMCVNEGGDYEQTLANTAALCAVLLRQYGLDVEDIRFHADFMEKECPHILISTGRTDEFLQMIGEELDGLQRG